LGQALARQLVAFQLDDDRVPRTVDCEEVNWSGSRLDLTSHDEKIRAHDVGLGGDPGLKIVRLGPALIL
jgi:hypothetical protein